jgi:hypothetical protein
MPRDCKGEAVGHKHAEAAETNPRSPSIPGDRKGIIGIADVTFPIADLGSPAIRNCNPFAHDAHDIYPPRKQGK